MEKLEVIKEAWGDKYPINGVDEVGFSNDCFERISIVDYDFIKVLNGFKIRPKSLQGIENNNGWIKGNEPNVPNESYFVFAFGGIYETFYDEELGWLYVNREFVTHFQPIEKPKPPIY